jgi:cbb3-type cytochrome oxidase subunit 3
MKNMKSKWKLLIGLIVFLLIFLSASWWMYNHYVKDSIYYQKETIE